MTSLRFAGFPLLTEVVVMLRANYTLDTPVSAYCEQCAEAVTQVLRCGDVPLAYRYGVFMLQTGVCSGCSRRRVSGERSPLPQTELA